HQYIRDKTTAYLRHQRAWVANQVGECPIGRKSGRNCNHHNKFVWKRDHTFQPAPANHVSSLELGFKARRRLSSQSFDLCYLTVSDQKSGFHHCLLHIIDSAANGHSHGIPISASRSAWASFVASISAR